MRPVAIVAPLAAVAVAVVVACGSEDNSTFGNGGGGDSGIGDPGDGSFNGSVLDNDGGFQACVSSAKDAALQPADLVIMFDKSGSMGDTTNNPPFDPSVKWNPVVAAMKAFFTDPASSTLNASLQFFPFGPDIEGVCNYNYATPTVAMSPLTQAPTFTAALDQTKPSGGTPTLPAYRGAVAYAKQIAQQRPDDKVVIVLITDGDPGVVVTSAGCSTGCPAGAQVGSGACFAPGCTENHECAADSTNPCDPSCNNTATTIATAVGDAKNAGLVTYVIGIGTGFEQGNLSSWAAAAGTTAIFVDANATGGTTTQFQNALNGIRGVSLTCNFAIPPPPAGQTLDKDKVNVVYNPSSGAPQVLPYSGDCSNANGWHYDDLNAPTKIELCPSSCALAHGDRNGKITLAFGCVTVGILK